MHEREIERERESVGRGGETERGGNVVPTIYSDYESEGERATEREIG